MRDCVSADTPCEYWDEANPPQTRHWILKGSFIKLRSKPWQCEQTGPVRGSAVSLVFVKNRAQSPLWGDPRVAFRVLPLSCPEQLDSQMSLTTRGSSYWESCLLCDGPQRRTRPMHKPLPCHSWICPLAGPTKTALSDSPIRPALPEVSDCRRHSGFSRSCMLDFQAF